MLIHITPRIYIPQLVHSCELLSLQVEELGLSLSQYDLATRKPYDNKRFSVACRRIGSKAIEGLLIEAEGHVPAYTSTAVWKVGVTPVHHLLLIHHTHHQVLDHQFDAVSDNMLLWYASERAGRTFERRWPEWANELTPAEAQPRMELLGPNLGGLPRPPGVSERLNARGFVLERTTNFALHTIERQRLIPDRYAPRMPSPADAFTVEQTTA